VRRRRGAVAAAVLLVAVIAVSLNVLPSAAQEPPPPIATEFLTDRAVFTDKVRLKFKVKFPGLRQEVVNLKDASRTVVARFTVQPRAQFPWHTHRGPVVVNVVSGEFTYLSAKDCVERVYPAGTALVDPGRGHVHTAFNDTDEVLVVVATFFGAPAEGPLLIPADPGCP
jgi:quercetin dioxygenase-like cupin family protein